MAASSTGWPRTGKRPRAPWAAIVCACISTGYCTGKPAEDSPGTLVLVSPHDEAIREEFTIAFEREERAAGRGTHLRWQPARGSANVLRLLESEFEAAGPGGSTGIDVMFGGGVPVFEKARRSGFLAPVQPDPEIAAAIPEQWGGVRFRAQDGSWWGATVNGFGILFHRKAHGDRGWPEPRQWSDLANPRYAGAIELADATESGSAQAAYEMILQQHGWDEGWPLLHRIAANSASFPRSASDVVRDVSTGQALAGMAIDFYAFTQISRSGKDVLGFHVPEGGTAYTPDPIAVLRGTSKREAAVRFLEFVISERGQRLWASPVGSRGGPVRNALFRPPILPSLYDHEDTLLVTTNPFEASRGFVLDQDLYERRSRLIGPLMKTACIDLEDLARGAWHAVRANPQDARLAGIFDALPFREDEALTLADEISDPVRYEQICERWYRFFKANYLRILELAGQGDP